MRLSSSIFIALSVAAGFAQTVTGTWQGTLHNPQNDRRLVIKVTSAGDASLRAVFYSIDQSGQGLAGSPVSLQGSIFKVSIPAINGSFEGKLSADGTTIEGTFVQGPPLPLTLVKATPATEWAIPEPPAPRRTMAASANPAFEVASIKPSDPAAQGESINIGRAGGNSFTTGNMALSEIIKFAYGLHDSQIVGGPSWLGTQKFDIVAKPDTDGVPSKAQTQVMVQKLLADRFGLVFHREKKEVSAYLITVDKAGLKLEAAEGNRGNNPGFQIRGAAGLGARNATIAEFAQTLQARFLDRPVVDRTGLADRYDFSLEWRPDTAEASPTLPAEIEARPDLLTAMRQKLGLKVEMGKTPVEALVIDKVNLPTGN